MVSETTVPFHMMSPLVGHPLLMAFNTTVPLHMMSPLAGHPILMVINTTGPFLKRSPPALPPLLLICNTTGPFLTRSPLPLLQKRQPPLLQKRHPPLPLLQKRMWTNQKKIRKRSTFLVFKRKSLLPNQPRSLQRLSATSSSQLNRLRKQKLRDLVGIHNFQQS